MEISSSCGNRLEASHRRGSLLEISSSRGNRLEASPRRGSLPEASSRRGSPLEINRTGSRHLKMEDSLVTLPLELRMVQAGTVHMTWLF